LKVEGRGDIIYGIVKSVSVREMQEIDRKAIEEIGIPSVMLMENAGRCVSEITMDMLGPGSRKRVAIFCGTGNNGGDGFVAARYLAKKDAEVEVYVVGKKARIKGDAKVNLERIGLEAREIDSPVEFNADLIIDAIFGIGLKGEVKEPARAIIKDLNAKSVPIIAVDVPSGLNADSGEVLGEAIKATKTVTMQFPKKGFCINQGPEHVGEVVAVDIGIPEELCAA